MTRLRVTKVIEEDTDRVLLEGTTEKGERRTFHVRKDPGGNVDHMLELIRSDEIVEVDL